MLKNLLRETSIAFGYGNRLMNAVENAGEAKKGERVASFCVFDFIIIFYVVLILEIIIREN